MPVLLQTIVLLILSNVFMTFAWLHLPQGYAAAVRPLLEDANENVRRLAGEVLVYQGKKSQ